MENFHGTANRKGLLIYVIDNVRTAQVFPQCVLYETEPGYVDGHLACPDMIRMSFAR